MKNINWLDRILGLFKSKTFWFYLLYIIVFVAKPLGFADFKPDSNFVIVLGAVVAWILRLVTDKASTLDRPFLK